MHDYDLKFLHRFYTNNLDIKRAVDIDLATPMILDAVKHDNRPLLDALFKRYIAVSIGLPSINYLNTVFNLTATDTTAVNKTTDTFRISTVNQFDFLKTIRPNQSQMKDSYWHLLSQIDKLALKNGNSATLSWLLDQYSDPLFPHFTEREQNRRAYVRDKKFGMYNYKHDRDTHPLPRQSKESIFAAIKDICHHAIDNNNPALAYKAIDVMQHRYAYFYNKAKRDDKTPYSFFATGALSIPTGIEDPIAYFGHIKELLQNADIKTKSDGSWGRYVRAHLVPALAHPNKDIVAFFKQQALRLSNDDRRAIMEDGYHVEIQNQKDNNVNFASTHIFFNRFPNALSDFLDILKIWDTNDTTYNYTEKFYARVRRYVDISRFSKRVFSQYDVQSRFEKTLVWSEIEYRLNILRNQNKRALDPISLTHQDYFTAAFNRALEYGHADDLSYLLEFATQQDKINPDAEKTFARLIDRQISYRTVISRDEKTISCLLDYLYSDAAKGFDDLNYTLNSLFKNFVKMPSREDRQRENGCSFYKKGLKIPKDQYSQSMLSIIGFIDKDYHRRNTHDAKQELIESVFGIQGKTNSDYAPLNDGIRTCGQEKNYEALSAMVDLWYGTARPHYKDEKYMRSIALELQQSLLCAWNSNEPMDAFLTIAQKIYDYNPDDAKMFLQGFMVDQKKSLLLARAIPDILDEDERETLKNPAIVNSYKYLDRILENRQTWQDANLEIPDDSVLYSPPTNFNQPLYEALIEPMTYYSTKENNKGIKFHAFKLSTLFVNMNKVSKYLNNNATGDEPVHDACLFALPLKGEWNKELWGNLAIKWGHGALKWLSFAPQIETIATNLNQNLPKDKKIDLSCFRPSDLRAFVHEHCAYKHKDKNPELAMILLDNGVDEKYFDETFTFIEAFRKNPAPPKRALPTIEINGNDVGAPGYHLETLEAGDYRNLWMGQFVNSCVHLGNQGRSLALEMFKGEQASAYAIKNKNNIIVGAFHSWISKDGNLVLNSWQRKNADFDFLKDAFLDAVADQALEKSPTMQRVVLGQGRLEKDTMNYEHIDADKYFGIQGDEEVNRANDHFTADTKVGQFIIKNRAPVLKIG